MILINFFCFDELLLKAGRFCNEYFISTYLKGQKLKM